MSKNLKYFIIVKDLIKYSEIVYNFVVPQKKFQFFSLAVVAIFLLWSTRRKKHTHTYLVKRKFVIWQSNLRKQD